MFFKKKKTMIDVRELQRRGVVRIPKKNIIVPTNRDGFIELGSKPIQQTPTTNSELFGFMNTTSISQEKNSKLIDLNNKIYKLEQRVELLEKKLDINKSSESNLGPMGW